jgi:hypothetical protein
VDPTVVQRRVGSCASGTYINAVQETGIVRCESAPFLRSDWDYEAHPTVLAQPADIGNLTALCHEEYGGLLISGTVVVENPTGSWADYKIVVTVNGEPVSDLVDYVALSSVPPTVAGNVGNKATLSYTITEPCYQHDAAFQTVRQVLAPASGAGFRYSAEHFSVLYVEANNY